MGARQTEEIQMENENKELKTLYRSGRHKMIAGVCGGLAEYFRIDPTWVRLGFVVLALFGGWAIILLYIIGAIVIPRRPSYQEQGGTPEQGRRHSKKAYFSGIILLAAGLLLLFSYFGILAWRFPPFWDVPWRLMWGLFLLTMGVMLFISHGKRAEEDVGEYTPGKKKRLGRMRRGAIIGGVCGGVARYFDVDPSFVRLAWVLGTIASAGLGLLTYLVMLVLVPKESSADNSPEQESE